MALSQCSTRMPAPSTGWQGLATSPAAKTCGSLAAQLLVDEDAVVHGRARRPGEPGRSGVAPMPTTSRSADSPVPSPRRTTRSPSGAGVRASSRASQAQVDAVGAVQVGERARPPRVPRTRSSGQRRARSTTVTSQPAVRAAAATSSPIQPAPTSTTRRPGRRRLLEAVGVLEGAQVGHGAARVVGRRQPPRGRRRWRAAAGRSASSSRADPDEPRGPRSSAVDPGRRAAASTSCSAYHCASWTKTDASALGAQQYALGQRRPLVGQVRLGAEQRRCCPS